jgi:hypothetical protein
MLSSLHVVSASNSAVFNTNAADYQVSVRCMMETDFVPEGDNEDFVEDDDFEWNN